MTDIIQASNQQFLGVLIFNISLIAANLWFHSADLDGLSSLSAAISFVFVAPSMLMGFAYLMLYTSTYEHTHSYEKAYSICNNLALSSAVSSFIGSIFTVAALMAYLFDTQYHTTASLLAMSIVIGLLYITKVSVSWKQAIGNSPTRPHFQ